jgi:dTDP-4-amino-4,6-dideoxygalactose transaminase
MSRIYLSSPHLGENEKHFVQDAFNTNWIAPLGPHVDGFEKDLEAYNKVAHAAALSSGTAAIHLALRILGVEEGDVVLCQSFTFCGSVNPVKYVGAEPVFVDSEPKSWNMDPQVLHDAIKDQKNKGKHIAAIMPVHLYGMPAQMDPIIQLAQKYDIPLIEDAAESLGSTYQGKKTGSLGEIGIYSFNGNKIITTSGGGALVSDNKKWVEKARFLATQARDEAPHYQHSTIGYNYRLSNVLAGIGRGQMQVLDERIQQRRAVHQRYRDYFQQWNDKGFNIQFQEGLNDMSSNRWLTTILIDPEENKGLTRDKIRLALAEDNIEARPLWKPMHLQPVFEGLPFYGSGVCERLFNIGLCLPSGSNMTEEEMGRIFKGLDGVLGS